MKISLTKKTERLIEERMKHGGYASTDPLIRAGLDALEQQESLGDFEPGEIDALLAEGEKSGRHLMVSRSSRSCARCETVARAKPAYRYNKQIVEIVRVMHGRRDFPRLFK